MDCNIRITASDSYVECLSRELRMVNHNMKSFSFFLRAGLLGVSLALLPFAAPTPLAQPAFAAHHLDWDAMDEDEFYERLGNISGEAVMAVMEDEDLDDPDIQSDVEGEIWERAEKAGCDHLLGLRKQLHA